MVFLSLCADSEFFLLKSDWLTIETEHSAFAQEIGISLAVVMYGVDQKDPSL